MKLKQKLNRFFHSTRVLIVILIIIVVILISYCNYLMKSNNVYMFNGKSDYIEIYNGVISLNYDINILEGSDITYIKDKDIVVTDYKIGYYTKENDQLVSIAVVSDNDQEGLSLKAVLEGIGTFNITELNTHHKYFTKKSRKLLDNGLYFLIEATSKDGSTITDITNLNINKLSK